MNVDDYRTLHVGESSVAAYKRTYSYGYDAAQWHFLERPFLMRLFSELHTNGNRRMIDLACGQGRITLLGGNYFDEVLGIDYSDEMIKVAEKNLTTSETYKYDKVRFHIGDVRTLALNRKFDVITAFRFFLNAQPDLRVECLRCIRRHLTAQGTLVANIHVAGASPLAIFYRISRMFRAVQGKEAVRVRNWMSLRSFRRLLSSEGFHITCVHRYSILPRIGTVTHSVAERYMKQIENLSITAPCLQWFAQAFIVCAKLNNNVVE